MANASKRPTMQREVLPGAGLSIGAGLGGTVGVLLTGTAVGLAVGGGVGAAVGLLVGAIARNVLTARTYRSSTNGADSPGSIGGQAHTDSGP